MDRVGMVSVNASRRMTAQASLLVRMLLVLVVVASFAGVATAQTNHINETCSRGSTPCTTVVGHVANGNQSLTDISKLYGVSVNTLLGSNNVDLTETSVTTKLVPEGKLVQVALRCSCVNNTRAVNQTSYTVIGGDTLSNIAEEKFSSLVTYQEIAAANHLPNPNDIQVGQKFIIPFPCACENNTFQGSPAIFLTYVIQKGDDLTTIAATYGTTVEDITKENSIENATNIVAGDRIQIPLSACISHFNQKARDYELLVPNGTYSLSPGAGCVQSSCYGSSLSSTPGPDLHSSATPHWSGSSSCPSLACNNNLALGDFTTSKAGDVCTVTTCAYQGYANSSTIFKALQVTNETVCPVETAAPPEQSIESVPGSPGAPAPAPASPPGGSPSSAVKLRGLLVKYSMAIALSICLVSMNIPFLE